MRGVERGALEGLMGKAKQMVGRRRGRRTHIAL